VPGYETIQWSAIFAPARTPRAIILKVNAEIDRLLKLDEVRQRLGNLGVEPAGGSPEQFSAYLRAEIAKWARTIKETGVRTE
jgi:tripartite-type tricarboxylate transporter receptor subunit TctC